VQVQCDHRLIFSDAIAWALGCVLGSPLPHYVDDFIFIAGRGKNAQSSPQVQRHLQGVWNVDAEDSAGLRPRASHHDPGSRIRPGQDDEANHSQMRIKAHGAAARPRRRTPALKKMMGILWYRQVRPPSGPCTCSPYKRRPYGAAAQASGPDADDHGRRLLRADFPASVHWGWQPARREPTSLQ
jgi:hypothetical protein